MDVEALQQRLQQALGQEFTVGPLLGQGGFAAVFRARDNVLNRDVAVKVLDVESAPEAVVAERFIREAQTVARLEHPHIVPIYKVGRREEIFYLIMRFIDGPSLGQFLDSQKKLAIGDAARIARQVADALAYAHSHEIVHRDIKPDNILLDRSGHVLVTDFGIAKAAQAAKEKKKKSGASLTTEGSVVGTPQYMSPEQASGDPLDGRSDIYSLGIVLYEMLTGSPPFDGDSAADILARQLTEGPEPIRRLRADVPEEMAVVLDRMLDKQRSKRFQMASEVSRALVGALPTAARDRVHIPLRRRIKTVFYRSLVGLGVAVLLLSIAAAFGAGLVAYYVFSKPPRVSARAPLPDSLTRGLRARRALLPGDVGLFAYRPSGQEDSTLLLLTRRRTVVVTTHDVRSYARDSVRRDMDLVLHGGLAFRLVIYGRGGRSDVADTVYRNLSFRDMMQIRSQLNREPGGAARSAPPPPPSRPAPAKARPSQRRRTRS